MREDDTPAEPDQPAELQVKGVSVFGEYWRRPTETQAAFCDGWFRTGDLTVVDNGNYRILGRISVDIIKSGGYKISALEIEETLGTHPAIEECAVIGVHDERWGERVCAAVVFKDNRTVPTDQLRAWGKERLASYKVPTQFVALDRLPRNAMGKVQKTQLKTQLHEKQPTR